MGGGAQLTLLDTHAVLWWATGDERLSAPASKAIARADAILVSPVSCWEIATLVRLRRIELDRDVHGWIADLLGTDGVEPAPLTVSSATAAGMLDGAFPGDPADRLLYATARELVVPFVSKDRRIGRYARANGNVRVVW